MADLLDNCWFTSAVGGTADFEDGTAVQGYVNLDGAGAEDGKVYPYRAQNADRSQWETGYATALLTSDGIVLERSDVRQSSNSDALVDFSTAPDVLITAFAEDIGGQGFIGQFEFTGDGTTDTFDLADEIADLEADAIGAVVLFLDGIWQQQGVHFAVTGTEISFEDAPAAPVSPETHNIRGFVLGGQGVVPGGGISVVADGTTENRLLTERFADRRNLEDFGVIDPETGDATDAMEAAALWLQSLPEVPASYVRTAPGGMLVLPPREIVITRSINLQSILGVGWGIEGNGCVIIAKCAGKTLFDMLGSRWGVFRDLHIVGDDTDAPAIGVQIGRLTTTSSGDCHTFINMKARGSFTRAPFYVMSSETLTMIAPSLYNKHNSTSSFCFMIDGSNHLGAITDFTAPDMASDTSMSTVQHNIVAPDFRKEPGSGSPVWLGDMDQFFMTGGYVVSYDGPGIVMRDAGLGFSNVHITTHIETGGSTSLIRFDRGSSGTVVLTDFDLTCHRPHCSDELVELGTNCAGIEWHGNIRVGETNTAVPTNGLFSDASDVVFKGDIYVPEADWGKPADFARFAGRMYHADLPYPQTDDWRMIAAVGAAGSAHTGTTSETTVVTVPIPGGSLGPNGVVKVKTRWTATNNANGKLLRVYYGSTMMGSYSLNNAASMVTEWTFQNRGSESSQIANPGGIADEGPSTGAFLTGAVNSGADQNLTLRVALTNSGDSVTVESYTVEIMTKR